MVSLKIKNKRKRAHAVIALCLSFGLLRAASVISAQQLSIRHYDVSDGLAHSHVSAVHQDRKGYLWLATWEGLSRFDGYRFTNYGERDGLGDPIINAITEDRQGHLWVGTNGGGVARLIDDPPSTQSATVAGTKQKFVSFRIADSPGSNRVNSLLFDSHDDLWCATDSGLYRAQNQNSSLRFEAIVQATDISVVFEDHVGRVWCGTRTEVIEIIQDQVIKYGASDDVAQHDVKSVIEDHAGRLLIANERSVCEFIAPPQANDRGRFQRLPLSFKPDEGIDTMLSDSAGALWIGTLKSLIKYWDGIETRYTNAQGLADNAIASLAEDRDGNLWIGTFGGGVCKLSNELIVSFTKSEGLPNQNIQKVFEDRQGKIYASIENGGLVKIVEGKVGPIKESQVPPFNNFNERILQDQRGDWWIGTNIGLYRFRGPELQLGNGKKFTAADGFPETSIMGGLYQDPTGKLWISPRGEGLFHFDQAQPGRAVFARIPSSAIEPFRGVLRMINDRSGTLWLGTHLLLGKLVNDRVVMQQPTEGLPETDPRFFFLDSRGWLWIGLRYKGVSVTKNPEAQTPQFINYSTANGLSSDSVWAIAEDDLGRMYFGTGKGLDQLDLVSGRIRQFNTNDGLASEVINYCMKDRAGNIWVATTLGLSKFNPRAERTTNVAAPIYLSRVQIAGEDLALPDNGARRVAQVDLSASRNNLRIEYVALSFQGENELRYQYKLEGVDKDWSSPTEARSINYARLAPGSYQFMVQAIKQNGVVSAPALFEFRIMPPIWQRWWFLMLTALSVALIIYAVYRQRLARLIELERVRTRIATDLHDDIGANLSLIAMLSEVARSQLQHDDSRSKEWFSTIATTSRDTVDAMSDIVWAVNPKRDHLRDLTRRMRRFADDIFAARNIEFQFRVPELDRDIRLGADLRREVFLIFKESINNIVRHSGCAASSVDLQVEDGWLVLTLIDDGKGIDEYRIGEGTGLGSMRQRAEKLGGSFEVSSPDADGTIVTLKVPLDHRARF